jgi:CheY-like chemotaxis protein
MECTEHSTTNSSGAVLVVEDNETTRGRMTSLLRSRGYEVTEAVDGMDAWRKVSARRFDAILLDLVLPHINGWQFRNTQLRHPELAIIPTIIVTARALRQPDLYALRSAEVVCKPFEDVALMQAVDRACRLHHPVAAAPDASVPGLFWSRRGEVACPLHAPDPTSRRWQEERWAPVVLDGFNRRMVYQCQHCSGHESAVDRSRRAPGPQGSTPPPRPEGN